MCRGKRWSDSSTNWGSSRPDRDVETIRDLIYYQYNAAKGAGGLYEFFRKRHPGEKKYYDVISPLVEKKYLKTILQCHICAGTLDDASPFRDREISVLDIDSILR